MFKGCFKEVLRMIQGSYRYVEDISMVFLESFEGVAKICESLRGELKAF